MSVSKAIVALVASSSGVSSVSVWKPWGVANESLNESSMLLANESNATPSTWLVCEYDWSVVAENKKGKPFSYARDAIEDLRNRTGMQATYVRQFGEAASNGFHADNLTIPDQGLTMERSVELLDSMGTMFDRMGLNWYISQGTAVGWLQHLSFVPWETEMNFQMPRQDAWKLHEHLVGLNRTDGTCYMQPSTLPVDAPAEQVEVVACLDPNNPKFVAVSEQRDGVVEKNLWIDLETELVVSKESGDMPNGEVPVVKRMFGNIRTNVAADIFHSLSLGDAKQEGGAILMNGGVGKPNRVEKSPEDMWTCKEFSCEQEPMRRKDSVLLSNHLKEGGSMRGPFYFNVDRSDYDGTDRTQCTVPRFFGHCTEGKPMQTYHVVQCED